MTRRSFQRSVALSCAFASGWFMLSAFSTLAVAPSFNRDVAGSLPAATDTSALSITVRTCPAGYDPGKVGADYRRDCTRPAGDTTFHLNQEGSNGPSASTGTSGSAPQESTVKFSGFAAGRYVVEADAPSEIVSAFIGGCASNARSFEGYPFMPFAQVVNGSVTIELLPGEKLTCEWYQIAAKK